MCSALDPLVNPLNLDGLNSSRCGQITSEGYALSLAQGIETSASPLTQKILSVIAPLCNGMALEVLAVKVGGGARVRGAAIL